MLTHNTNMANMTLSIPKELHTKMRKHSELRWSDVARKAFEKKIKELEIVDRILSKSKLTEEDAVELGNKIKHEIARKHGLIK